MRERWPHLQSSWNNPEHRHGWIYLLKSPSSMFSLTVDILIRLVSHFLFSSRSQIPVKILYALYISSDQTSIGLCSKSNTLMGCKQNNVPGIPWFKKRLPSLNSILHRTQFSRNNLSESNVVKDTQNENAKEQPKRL